MTNQPFDVTPFLTQDEGQHFDRKSMLDGPPGAKRARDRSEMRREAAEYVAAFANADGGVLLLGVEDDGSVTGHQLPPEAVDALLAAPGTRLDPPQPPGFTVSHKGVELIVFDVPAADAPVQMTGNGFPLRVGDQTVWARETQIAATKQQGMYESWESRRSSCSLKDLDPKLLARARAGAGLSALSDVRALLMAYRRGRVDNAALRLVTGLDTLRASHLLRGLRDRELLTLHAHGGDSFYTLTPVVRELAADRGKLPSGSGGAAHADRGELPTRIGGSSARIEGSSARIEGSSTRIEGSCPKTCSARLTDWDRGLGKNSPKAPVEKENHE